MVTYSAIVCLCEGTKDFHRLEDLVCFLCAEDALRLKVLLHLQNSAPVCVYIGVWICVCMCACVNVCVGMCAKYHAASVYLHI